MLLQNILLADNTDGLHCHSQGTVRYENDSCVIFEKGAEWSTDAYLNAFSLGKWCTYCDLERITLQIALKGTFIVRVFSVDVDRRKFCRRQIAGGRVSAAGGETVQYDIPMQKKGVVYFSLKAVTDGAVCSGAFFEGETR